MADDSTPERGGDLRAWVAAIMRGDLASEQLLVQRYQRVVRVLIARNCRVGESRVEDICQDVLMRLLQRVRAGGIDDPAAIPAYLHSMIRHACLALYRQVSATASIAIVVEAADPAPGPELCLETNDTAQYVRALLEQLPVPRDRELLRQFYLLGRSQSEVCAALQIDAEHFRRVAHRARSRLRALLVAGRVCV
jgi:RNA polymerase sigma-70 factor (ECF subfamily)